MHRCLWLLSLGLVLCSCASTTPPSSHYAGVCNTLRSRLIFSGSTSIQRQADIERAEVPLQRRDYHEVCE